ncbi:MAG: hypothetical protein WBQ73_00190 [Candidatus Babeliales bacterium]
MNKIIQFFTGVVLCAGFVAVPLQGATFFKAGKAFLPTVLNPLKKASTVRLPHGFGLASGVGLAGLVAFKSFLNSNHSAHQDICSQVANINSYLLKFECIADNDGEKIAKYSKVLSDADTYDRNSAVVKEALLQSIRWAIKSTEKLYNSYQEDNFATLYQVVRMLQRLDGLSSPSHGFVENDRSYNLAAALFVTEFNIKQSVQQIEKFKKTIIEDLCIKSDNKQLYPVPSTFDIDCGYRIRKLEIVFDELQENKNLDLDKFKALVSGLSKEMISIVDSEAQHRWNEVRSELDRVGYSRSFSVNACGLAKDVRRDVLWEKLKQWKEKQGLLEAEDWRAEEMKLRRRHRLFQSSFRK